MYKKLIAMMLLLSNGMTAQGTECNNKFKFQDWQVGVRDRTETKIISDKVHHKFQSAVSKLEHLAPETSILDVQAIIDGLPYNVVAKAPVLGVYQWYFDLEDVNLRIKAQFFDNCLVSLQVTDSPKPINMETIQIYSRRAKDQSNVNK